MIRLMGQNSLINSCSPFWHFPCCLDFAFLSCTWPNGRTSLLWLNCRRKSCPIRNACCISTLYRWTYLSFSILRSGTLRLSGIFSCWSISIYWGFSALNKAHVLESIKKNAGFHHFPWLRDYRRITFAWILTVLHHFFYLSWQLRWK